MMQERIRDQLENVVLFIVVITLWMDCTCFYCIALASTRLLFRSLSYLSDQKL
jgi:hypothetical protein